MPAKELLPPAQQSPYSGSGKDSGTFLARAADNGQAVLWLTNRAVLLDSASRDRKPAALPDKINQLFHSLRVGDNFDERTRNTIHEGVLYFLDSKMIVGAALNGQTIEPYYCTESVSSFDLGVLHVGTKTTELSRRKVPRTCCHWCLANAINSP